MKDILLSLRWTLIYTGKCALVKKRPLDYYFNMIDYYNNQVEITYSCFEYIFFSCDIFGILN